MKRNIPLIMLTLLALMVSGCEVFPYVFPSATTVSQDSPQASATKKPTDSLPTATLIPSVTPTFTPEVAAEEPADSAPPVTPVYALQAGSPVGLPNFNHPEAGCDWLGVAGQVFNQEGLEVLGLTIQVGDSQNPNQEPLQAQTGSALAYGLGGYEIKIAQEAMGTTERFWIQVLNADGAPLTARHFFETFGDCQRNLILINLIPLAEEDQTKQAPTATPTLQAYP